MNRFLGVLVKLPKAHPIQHFLYDIKLLTPNVNYS